MTGVFELPVFPAADVFPMLPDDELAELAADIKANGLREPLVIATVDETEMLVDGRNRREACRIAEVSPTTRHLNGEDPTAFVVSANLRRRNLTQSQKAMATAFIYPDPEKGGRGKKAAATNLLLSGGFSRQLLDQARVVLAYSPPAAKTVLAGASLKDAYQEAVDLKKAADTDEARLAEMRAEASDLAELVVEDRMTLTEAWAAFEQRKRDAAAAEANLRETLLRLSEDAYRGTVAWGNLEFVLKVRERLADADFHKAFVQRLRVKPDEFGAISKGAVQLLAVLKDQAT